VNVVAPISGTASISNQTANYVASRTDIPLLGVFAIYPSSSAICQSDANTVGFNPGQSNCGLDIAELAASCDSTFESLPSGQQATLALWPQSALNGSISGSREYSAASPTACQKESDYPPPTTYEQPSTIQLTDNLTSNQAQPVMTELSSPPKDWVVLDESIVCQSKGYSFSAPPGPQYIGQVIASKPAGISGCLEG
jgi:hypothetical protein